MAGSPHGWRGRGAVKKILKLRVSIKLPLSLSVDAGRLQQNAAVLFDLHHKASVGISG
jgi:hypothetical protein